MDLTKPITFDYEECLVVLEPHQQHNGDYHYAVIVKCKEPIVTTAAMVAYSKDITKVLEYEIKRIVKGLNWEDEKK